jgi:serine/threonine protein kinase
MSDSQQITDAGDGALPTTPSLADASDGPTCFAPVTGPGTPRIPTAMPEALDSRFEFVQILGSGGMGVVILARDRKLGRDVAIKLIRPRETTTSDGAQAAAMFEQEARVLAKLEDDHVVRIYEYGTAGDVPYLVMELVRGRSLAARLATGRPTLVEAARLALDIARGLLAAHTTGIAHLDLKPANVFLAESGRAKVADFGLARITGDAPADGEKRRFSGGTPGYMAPEQWDGRESIASDVYAFGVVLHEMLTGQRLFAASSHSSLRELQKLEVPPPPSRINPVVPPALDAITTGTLHIDPAQRPDINQIVDSLTGWLRQVENRTSRSAASLGLPERPYKVLERFSASDAAIFFGRDAETAELVEMVESPDVRLLLLFGPCGIGKSSLVRAGLACALDPSRFEAILLVSGDDPAAALTATLAGLAATLKLSWPAAAGPAVPITVADLENSPAHVVDLLVLLSRVTGKTYTIVIDQIEELFTLNSRGAGRVERFFALVKRRA